VLLGSGRFTHVNEPLAMSHINATFIREAPAQMERSKKQLKKLLSLPTNAECVDCRSRNPRWASINIGVFMCIPCSGIHRTLGTHISKVKSTNLDEWTSTWVKHMGAWGNHKANDFWEAELPENSPERPTLREASNLDPKLERFIRVCRYLFFAHIVLFMNVS
jgi:stromal membrane-associated protein